MKSKKIFLVLFILQLILSLSLTVSAETTEAYDVSFTMEASASVVSDEDTFTVKVSIDEIKEFTVASAILY